MRMKKTTVSKNEWNIYADNFLVANTGKGLEWYRSSRSRGNLADKQRIEYYIRWNIPELEKLLKVSIPWEDQRYGSRYFSNDTGVGSPPGLKKIQEYILNYVKR